MTTMVVPPGYRRVQILKAVDYARETLGVGTLAVVDETTAATWIRAKCATAVEADAPRTMIRTSCPRCGSAMEYVKEPQQHERWTQCLNARCNFGWLR